jgi:hypothetical protein
MASPEDLTWIGVGTRPAMVAGGHDLGPDHVALGGASRGVGSPSRPALGRRPQDAPRLATGTSTGQPRQTPALSAALPHRVVAADAMVAEHPGSLGRRRRGQSPRRPERPTRPAAAPAAAWVRLCLLTSYQACPPAGSTQTTVRMAPHATLTSMGRRRVQEGSSHDWRRLQVMPLGMHTPRPPRRLTPTRLPVNADVLTVLRHQRPGAPGAGLWGTSCPTSAVPHQGWQWPSTRRDPSAIRGQGSLPPAYTVTILGGGAVHDLHHSLVCNLLHDDESIANHGARTSAMLPPHDRPCMRQRDTTWGCVLPAHNAPAWRRTPRTLTVTPPPPTPAPDRADVPGGASGTAVTVTPKRPGWPQMPTGYTLTGAVRPSPSLTA